MCLDTAYQCVQVDVGPLNLLGPFVSFNHGPAQDIQVFLPRVEGESRRRWFQYFIYLCKSAIQPQEGTIHNLLK